MIKGKLLRITPLRKGLAEYLDEEQLYKLKKKLVVELKLLKFLSIYRVADSDCMSFARDEDNKYIHSENSANFYAKKHSRTLYDEELIDIYLVKFNNDAGRGENIYIINENGLRLLGIDDEFEVGLNDIQKQLQKTQYVVYRKEQLLIQGYKIFDVFYNDTYFHIKYGNEEDIFNEYVFTDEYKFSFKFKEFLEDHSNNYNDTYIVLIEEEVRAKELNIITGHAINPIVISNKFKIIEKRNGRNQKTIRPYLEIIGG